MSDPAGIDGQASLNEPANAANEDQERAATEYRQAPAKEKLSMQVKVYSPFRDYYDGEAFSLSAVNATGPFDILPRHYNFISLLGVCDLVIRTVNRGEQRIRISGGILHVKANRAVVFLDV